MIHTPPQDNEDGREGRTVLVVEDHEATRCVMLRLLRHAGHAAAGVPGGEEALLWMRARRPALVILDVMMPVLDGVTTLRRLRQMKNMETVPVIIYTAGYSKELERQAKELGAGCLQKAKSWDVVLQEIDRLVQPAPYKGEKAVSASDGPTPDPSVTAMDCGRTMKKLGGRSRGDGCYKDEITVPPWDNAAP